MVIGVVTARLAVYEAFSLKDKRRVVKSLKDRLRNKFNVSVAETDAHDSRQRAVITAAIVATDTQFAERCLQQVVNVIEESRGASLLDFEIQML